MLTLEGILKGRTITCSKGSSGLRSCLQKSTMLTSNGTGCQSIDGPTRACWIPMSWFILHTSGGNSKLLTSKIKSAFIVYLLTDCHSNQFLLHPIRRLKKRA